ncbi:helix-turn-helix transcriptional regulator [Actimicrobium antarcticum]|uniref:HTH cro/C1-type domain-containing protein n=1 Tax=Actimicrobium antarcticum TaxID=1051899 RepID=A0ABP7SUF6_9BURK
MNSYKHSIDGGRISTDSALTGARLKAERERRKVTKVDLTSWAGITRPTLDHIEAGGESRDLQRIWDTLILGRPGEQKKRGPPRVARAYKLPPEWLVLMRDLAHYAQPDDASVRAFLEIVDAMLGSDVGGYDRAAYTSTAALFDARIAAIAKTYPRWHEALSGWLLHSAATNVHPLFCRMARRAEIARVAIGRGVKPSKVFGLVKVGHPAGVPQRVAGVKTYIGTGATQNDDAVRLAYLHIMNAISEAEAIKSAVLTCYGDTTAIRVIGVRLKKARATGTAEVSPSNFPVSVEIAAIKNKYNVEM